MKRIIIVLVAVMLLSPLQAVAEVISSTTDATKSKRFAEYVYSPTVLNTLLENVVNGDKKTGFICNDPHPIPPDSFSIIKPITFSDKTQLQEKHFHPLSGEWMHRFTITRCGKKQTYTTYFVAQEENPPKSTSIMGGVAAPDSDVLKDIIRIIRKMVSKEIPKNCSDAEYDRTFFVTNTEAIEAKSSDAIVNENWFIAACGKQYEKKIEYKDDGRGGTFYNVK